MIFVGTMVTTTKSTTLFVVSADATGEHITARDNRIADRKGDSMCEMCGIDTMMCPEYGESSKPGSADGYASVGWLIEWGQGGSNFLSSKRLAEITAECYQAAGFQHVTVNEVFKKDT